ncbi:MAG: hypothetical protein V7677_19570, partial [Motiliproteus sp.]
RIENPRVGGSIPPPGTKYYKPCSQMQGFVVSADWKSSCRWFGYFQIQASGHCYLKPRYSLA